MLEHWDLLEQDLIDAGTDPSDPAIRRGRSWRWGQARIVGLLTKPPIGFVKVADGPDRVRLEPLWGTRIQTALLTRQAAGQ